MRGEEEGLFSFKGCFPSEYYTDEEEGEGEEEGAGRGREGGRAAIREWGGDTEGAGKSGRRSLTCVFSPPSIFPPSPLDYGIACETPSWLFLPLSSVPSCRISKDFF